MNAEISVMTENVHNMDASDLIRALDCNARMGADWLRVHVARALDTEPYTKETARLVPQDELDEGLKSVSADLCVAAVSRNGLAHRDGFAALQTHIRRAFPQLSGVSVRFSDKAKVMEATKAYTGQPNVIRSRDGYTSAHGEIVTYQAGIFWKHKSVAEDIADDTEEVTAAVGEPSETRLESRPAFTPSDGEIRFSEDYQRLTSGLVNDAIERERKRVACQPLTPQHQAWLRHVRDQLETEAHNRWLSERILPEYLREEGNALEAWAVIEETQKIKERAVKRQQRRTARKSA